MTNFCNCFRYSRKYHCLASLPGIKQFLQRLRVASFWLGRTERPSAVLYRQRTELLALAMHHGFRNVRVFGSCARGEDTPGSDIDLLVDGVDVTLFNISAFAQDASDLMDGIPVDVVVTGTTSPLMDRITSEAVPL